MNTSFPVSRRQFLQASLAATAGAAVFPTIVPASVLGADAPSKKIQVGQIGCGRIALGMDLPGIIKHDIARVVAVCDLDSKRLANARKFVEDAYAKKPGSAKAVAVNAYGNYRELLKDPQVDAVAISTPDHWHSEPIIAAALAGKDIYVQKPLTMTLVEGRAVSDIVRARKRAFQIGSQQRSGTQFRLACELVRTGGSASCAGSKSACRWIPRVAARRRCRFRPTWITTNGWAARRRCPTPKTASIPSARPSSGPGGCALIPIASA